jgi:hypothetical protein
MPSVFFSTFQKKVVNLKTTRAGLAADQTRTERV